MLKFCVCVYSFSLSFLLLIFAQFLLLESIFEWCFELLVRTFSLTKQSVSAKDMMAGWTPSDKFKKKNLFAHQREYPRCQNPVEWSVSCVINQEGMISWGMSVKLSSQKEWGLYVAVRCHLRPRMVWVLTLFRSIGTFKRARSNGPPGVSKSLGENHGYNAYAMKRVWYWSDEQLRAPTSSCVLRDERVARAMQGPWARGRTVH